jgi:hypothetical protein
MMPRSRQFKRCVLLAAISFPGWVSLAGVDPAESCVASAFIPSADNVHGETRLLRRGDAACVQTILHSASFRRGIKEVLSREKEVWPAGRTGYEDSQRCCGEIEKVKQIILEEPRTEDDAGRPYTLLMEYTFQPGACRIEFFHADVKRDTGSFLVTSKTPISQIAVSDDYMSRAMLIMTAAAFNPLRNDSISLLESAGWQDLSATADPLAPAPLR